MATKLALKGILAGVDKIPDQWFDKIPYYQSEEMKQAAKNKKKSKKDKYSRRIHSTEDRYRKEGRNNNGEIDTRRRSHDDDYDDGYDSRDRRHRDSRRDSRRADSVDRPKRSHQDGEKYSAASGDYAQPRARYPYEQPIHPNGRPNPHHSSLPGTAYAPYPVAGAVPGAAPTYTPTSPINTDINRPLSSGPRSGTGYVPYADIYNSPSQPGFSQDSHYNQSYGAAPRNGSHSHTQSPQEYSGDLRRSHRGRGRHHDDDYSDESEDSYDDRRRHRHRQPRSRSRSHERSRRGSRADGHGSRR